ncbi:MAG: cellulase family glycosylhydrolase [Bacteroidota bacterium]|nr:cellulase family glycosylhydrolase [Bacteroidota bacterium]
MSQPSSFVRVKDHRFQWNDKPYYFIGANMWYGSLLTVSGNGETGGQRLKKELDFLKSKGVTNLRVVAGAEGAGKINGIIRIGPSLQPSAGVFNQDLLKGLDFLLAEMGKRDMKAIIFLSNNWEWSGGFLQYLNWNGLIPDSILRRKLSWDEWKDNVSRFYSCEKCKSMYEEQVKLIVQRTNSVTKKKYKDDPAIMAWEIANEPRPMRPYAINDYKAFISRAAAFIKSLDKNHLVTTGSEGEMGSENLEVFNAIHSDKNIDYATIHIWPKNWSWFRDTAIAGDMAVIKKNTLDYISKHAGIVKEINKPMVIEEFGLPRDNHSFSLRSSTSLRDNYYTTIFSSLLSSAQNKDVICGANFWAFSGSGRPAQLWWKNGDDLLGDPPMEEQGLNSVFDRDKSTWKVISHFTKKLDALP